VRSAARTELERASPALIFGNVVNQLMTTVPSPGHARALSIVSPRKIWLAREGDLVITPTTIDSSFKEYACKIMAVDPMEIGTMSPDGEDTRFLADRVIDSNFLTDIERWRGEHPDSVL